jgi:hypothetical protein
VHVRSAAPFVGVGLVLLALAGCASEEATAAPRSSHTQRVTPATTSTTSDQPAALPAPCFLVSADDVSLMVGMDDWQYTEDAAPDHTVCAYRGRGGVTVTTVVTRLGTDGRAPAAVCSPPGSTAEPAHAGEVCRYAGPTADTTTVVVSASGLAIGVRVVGRNTAGGAAALAAHALTHL